MLKKITIVVGLLILFGGGIWLGNNLDRFSFSGGRDGLRFIQEQADLGAGDQLTKEGIDAPDFTLTDIDGRTFSLSDFRGSPVIIEIMAAWCGTCISETDDFRKALDAYPELSIISIDVDPTETEKEIDRFRRAYSRPDFDNRWLFARDTDQISVKYGAPFTGTTILIDAEGKIAYRDSWSTDFEEIQKAMIKLGYSGGGGITSFSEQSVGEKLAAYNLDIEQEIEDLRQIYGNQEYRVALIKIDNMFCPSCPRMIKDVLYKTVAGIKEVRISFYEGKGLVVYDHTQSSPEDIVSSPIFDDTQYPDAPTIYDASIIKDISL